MKKLFLFIVSMLFVSGLFSSPEFPTSIYNNRTKPFIFVSSDGLNKYELLTFQDSKLHSLNFINTSLVTDVMISINIEFENEQKLKTFIKDFDIGNIDNEFKKVKYYLDSCGFIPDYFYKEQKLKSVIYMINTEQSTNMLD